MKIHFLFQYIDAYKINHCPDFNLCKRMCKSNLIDDSSLLKHGIPPLNLLSRQAFCQAKVPTYLSCFQPMCKKYASKWHCLCLHLF